MASDTQATPAIADQRGHERVTTVLTGKLFGLSDDFAADCEILNLSADGAGVRCAKPPSLHALIILHIDGFGRYEGVATRHADGELGLRFVGKQAQRQRLMEDLICLVKAGKISFARLRPDERAASAPIRNFIRADGSTADCEVLDVSLQGISLRTDARPPIGEVVRLGHTHGRVVRYHEDRITVQFLDLMNSSAATH